MPNTREQRLLTGFTIISVNLPGSRNYSDSDNESEGDISNSESDTTISLFTNFIYYMIHGLSIAGMVPAIKYIINFITNHDNNSEITDAFYMATATATIGYGLCAINDIFSNDFSISDTQPPNQSETILQSIGAIEFD